MRIILTVIGVILGLFVALFYDRNFFQFIPAAMIWGSTYLGWKKTGWGLAGFCTTGIISLVFFRYPVFPLIILPFLIFGVAGLYVWQYARSL